MPRNEEQQPQATKTTTETPKAVEPKKRDKERPTTDTLDDNPLICRGID